MRDPHTFQVLMSSPIRVGRMASWQSVGDQGEWLKRYNGALVSRHLHWDIEPPRLPTKFRCVFHSVTICTELTLCLSHFFGLDTYSRTRRFMRGRAQIIHLFRGSSTTLTSPMPPQQLDNRTVQLSFCSQTRVRAISP